MDGEGDIKTEGEGGGEQATPSPEPGVSLTPPVMDPKGLIKPPTYSASGKLTLSELSDQVQTFIGVKTSDDLELRENMKMVRVQFQRYLDEMKETFQMQNEKLVKSFELYSNLQSVPTLTDLDFMSSKAVLDDLKVSVSTLNTSVLEQGVKLAAQGVNQVNLSTALQSVLTCVNDITKIEYNQKLLINANKEGKWVKDGFRDSNAASLKTDGILNNVAKNLATLNIQQGTANLSGLNPNSNSYEPKFTPRAKEGGGVRLGSSFNPIFVGDNDVRVMTETSDLNFAGLDPSKFYLPSDSKYWLVSNAIELEFDKDAYKLWDKFSFIEKKIYDVTVKPEKMIEYTERRVGNLYSAVKDFDSKDLMGNFDDFLVSFWRNCQRLHIEDHMSIKYCIFEKLDSISKQLCALQLEPGKCHNYSVFKYFSELRKVLLPLNDLQSAKMAYSNLKQNSLALDVFFERKHALFLRCHNNDIRETDYYDFHQHLCDTFTHKGFAFEVRKLIKSLKLDDIEGLRKGVINLGETFYQSMISNQIDDAHKECLITQAMKNNVLGDDINSKGIEYVAQVENPWEENGHFDQNDQGFEQGFEHFDEGENHDGWYYENDFIEESICAATNDERSCYYCMATTHLIANCPDKQNRKPAHQNSLYHPSKLSSNFRGYNSSNGSGYRSRGNGGRVGAYRGNRGSNYNRGSITSQSYRGNNYSNPNYSNPNVNRGAYNYSNPNINRGAYNNSNVNRGGYRGYRSSSSYLPSYNKGNYGNNVGYVHPEMVEQKPKEEMESTLVASIIDWF